MQSAGEAVPPRQPGRFRHVPLLFSSFLYCPGKGERGQEETKNRGSAAGRMRPARAILPPGHGRHAAVRAKTAAAAPATPHGAPRSGAGNGRRRSHASGTSTGISHTWFQRYTGSLTVSTAARRPGRWRSVRPVRRVGFAVSPYSRAQAPWKDASSVTESARLTSASSYSAPSPRAGEKESASCERRGVSSAGVTVPSAEEITKGAKPPGEDAAPSSAPNPVIEANDRLVPKPSARGSSANDSPAVCGRGTAV